MHILGSTANTSSENVLSFHFPKERYIYLVNYIRNNFLQFICDHTVFLKAVPRNYTWTFEDTWTFRKKFDEQQQTKTKVLSTHRKEGGGIYNLMLDTLCNMSSAHRGLLSTLDTM